MAVVSHRLRTLVLALLLALLFLLLFARRTSADGGAGPARVDPGASIEAAREAAPGCRRGVHGDVSLARR